MDHSLPLSSQPYNQPFQEGEFYISAASLKEIEKLTHEARKDGLRKLHSTQPKSILDLGCGAGSMSIQMGKQIEEGGRVTGVDLDLKVIKQASDSANHAGVWHNTRFTAANAYHLPFDNEQFDACWCERLFQHITNPLLVMKEMLRVCVSRSLIIVVDSDWHSLSISHEDCAAERRFVAGLSRLVTRPEAGRDLPRLLQFFHFSDISIKVYPIVWRNFDIFRLTTLAFPDLISRLIAAVGEDFSPLLSSFHRKGSNGEFFACANMVFVSGRAPHFIGSTS